MRFAGRSFSVRSRHGRLRDTFDAAGERAQRDGGAGDTDRQRSRASGTRSPNDDRSGDRRRRHAHREAGVAPHPGRRRDQRLLHRRAHVRLGRRPPVRLQPAAAVLDDAAVQRRRAGARRADRDRGEGAAGRRAGQPLRPGAEAPGALQRPAGGRRPDAGERPAAPDAVPQPQAGPRRSVLVADASEPADPISADPRFPAHAPAPASSLELASAHRRERDVDLGAQRASFPAATRSKSARSGTSPRKGRSSPATTIASCARSRPTARPTAAAWRSTSRSSPATSFAARSTAAR